MSECSIKTLKVCLYWIPLDEVLLDAEHGSHTHWELVTVTLKNSDGQKGTGYTYTGGKGDRAVW